MPLQKSGECSSSPFESAGHSKDGTVLCGCLLVSCDQLSVHQQSCSSMCAAGTGLLNAAAALQAESVKFRDNNTVVESRPKMFL